MAMTAAERQRAFKERAKASGKQVLKVVINEEAKKKLEALASSFECSITDTLEHIIHYAHDEVKWED